MDGSHIEPTQYAKELEEKLRFIEMTPPPFPLRGVEEDTVLKTLLELVKESEMIEDVAFRASLLERMRCVPLAKLSTRCGPRVEQAAIFALLGLPLPHTFQRQAFLQRRLWVAQSTDRNLETYRGEAEDHLQQAEKLAEIFTQQTPAPPKSSSKINWAAIGTEMLIRLVSGRRPGRK